MQVADTVRAEEEEVEVGKTKKRSRCRCLQLRSSLQDAPRLQVQVQVYVLCTSVLAQQPKGRLDLLRYQLRGALVHMRGPTL